MRTRTPRPLDGVMAAIDQAERVAIVSHIIPDGDTVGSALALRLGLMQQGKRVSLFCDGDVPLGLRFLPGAAEFRRPEDMPEQEQFDLLLCVDVPEAPRLGKAACLLSRAAHTAQIDHHGTNPGFCEQNCVDTTASATCLIARELLEGMGCEITPEMATCLLVGISTDTLHFTMPGTSAEALETAAQLMDSGAPLIDVHRRMFRQHTPGGVQLLQRALASLTFHAEGRVTTLFLTQQDFQECGALEEEVLAFANFGVSIEGVRMSAFLREKPDGAIVVSFRAYAPDNVCRAAMAFGGGGHAQAAGCTLHLPMAQAVQAVAEQMQRALEEKA